MGAEQYKNAEGYADPTAGLAMSAAMREYRRRQKKRFAARHRKKIYVTSAFVGDARENVRAARRYCRRVVDLGHIPLSGRLLFQQFLSDAAEEERELALSFGLALLGCCDEVWTFGQITEEMCRELREAQRLQMRVRCFDADGREIEGGQME